MKAMLVTFVTFFILSISNFLSAEEGQKIFLLRHAEKEINVDSDPSLTVVGRQRAEKLVGIFQSVNISAIFSTEYKRTLQTATPLAEALGLEIRRYDPRALDKFAEQLQQETGNLLVIGHSNTTPQLSELLGGKSFGQIDDSEYNVLYRLQISGTSITTDLLDMRTFSGKDRVEK